MIRWPHGLWTGGFDVSAPDVFPWHPKENLTNFGNGLSFTKLFLLRCTELWASARDEGCAPCQTTHPNSSNRPEMSTRCRI